MTLEELADKARRERDEAQRLVDALKAEARAIIEGVDGEHRSDLTDEEHTRYQRVLARSERAKADLEATQGRVADLEALEAEERQRQADQSKVHDSGATRRAYDQVARVTSEERTYTAEKDPHGVTFLRDVARATALMDPQATERIARHAQEEQVERGGQLVRATGTSAFSGLVVPQYLTDMYAPATAAKRPFADVCNSHPLPDEGMTMEISRITTPSSVADQASEGAAASETDIDDTLLSVPVRTAAGQQTISRQAIDRGTGIESVTMQDLLNRYATNLDSQLLNRATTGLAAAASPVTYTDGTPTVEEFLPVISRAAGAAETALLGQASPSHVVMHPRRWYWVNGALSDKHPLLVGAGLQPLTAGSDAGNGYGSAIRGRLPNGLGVVVDANVATNLGVGTNEDEVYVVSAEECHLWENPSAPMFIRAEQPKAANLQVLLVVWGYYAATFQRYAGGQQKVSGTGLIPPA